MLHRLKLPWKLSLLFALSTLAAIAIGAIGAASLHSRMLDDRVDKLQAAVDSAVGIARALETRVTAHEITREDATAALRRDIHAIRFDNGDGYVSVIDAASGTVLMHGANPTLEGKSNPADAATGRPISAILLDAVQASDTGLAAYMYVKPGQAEPLRKLVAVSRFAPWNMVFYAGAYVDDLEASFRGSLLTMAAIGGGILLLAALVARLIGRDITRSLGGLKAVMGRLAGDDLDVAVAGTERRDEVGDMAAVVQVFQQHMVKGRQHDAEREQDRLKAARERTAAMRRMADTFEAGVGEILHAVVASATELEATANAMSATAAETSRQSATVAVAAEEAGAGMQTVASASEELSSSINEITRQVGQAARISEHAAADAARTDAIVRALADGAQKIGEVVTLITSIANQTNLLALNATIEAARAGDAGKGFAVVAAEVKGLAGQTARATHDIAEQVTAIQSSTGQAVEAIRAIIGTIAEISAVSAAIASAVEQQSGATGEIARNVQQTAVSAQDITANIGSVSQAADGTGAAAGQVLGAASELSKRADQLAGQVRGFLTNMRAA